LGDQIEVVEMDGTCGTYGRIVHIQGLVGNPKESDHLEDLGADGSI